MDDIIGSFTTFDVSRTGEDLIVITENSEIILYDLKYNENTVLCKNIQPLHIKFYPVGNKLFTTSCNLKGLQVWDQELSEMIFKYKDDKINYHNYNHLRCVSACTDDGIKMYDLRCRYHTNFAPFKYCKKIDWNEYSFCATGRNQVLFGDIRKISENKIMHENNIYDTKFYLDRFCFLKKNKQECVIKINDMSKSCKGSIMCVVKDIIVIADDNNISLFTLDSNRYLKLDYITRLIELQYHSTRDAIYLLDDKKIVTRQFSSFIDFID
ncbi:hypothetical protein COBT_002677 [Conglomerata obtusa]